MRRSNKILASLISVFTVFAAVSCNKEYDFGFKDLCFYHPHTAPVRVDVDWSEFSHIEEPTGMTVYVWPENPDEQMRTFVTHDINSITLDLKAGLFNAFVFNQSDGEFGSFDFYNLDEYDKAQVRVVESRTQFVTTKYPVTKVVNDPEWFAVDRIEDVEVTQEMVDFAEEEFLAAFRGTSEYKRSTPTKTQIPVGTLVPKSVTKQLDFLINLTNYKSLKTPVGYLGGLADGYYIASGKTTEGKITHSITFTELKSKVDADTQKPDPVEAVLLATITTFGNPQGHTGLSSDNTLILEFTLRNGEVKELVFEVGDQIADLNTYDGTLKDDTGSPVWPKITLDVELPFIEVSDGIFDVGVGGWGDENEKELPLN